MTEKTVKERYANDQARTEGVRKVGKEYADDQRELQDKFRRKLN